MKPSRPPRRRRGAAPAAGARPADAGDDGRMPVTAAFYPLQFAAERVGGDHVRVTSLTKPGVGAPRPRADPQGGRVAGVGDGRRLPRGLPAGRRRGRAQPRPRMPRSTSRRPPASRCPPDGDHAGETDEEHAEHDDHGGAADPHFWLDPTRLADVATALGEDFARRDPANAADYRANAAALVATSRRLDAELRDRPGAVPHPRARHRPRGLRLPRRPLRPAPGGRRRGRPRRRARRRDAARPQRPRAGGRGARRSTPRAWSPRPWPRPSPASRAPEVAVLDPLEGITDASRGRDYLEVMRANLATLRAGQECS